MPKCLICGSADVDILATKIADFLVERIYGEKKVKDGISTELCHCNNCSFSFYSKRLTNREEALLYEDYRGIAYQKTREKYDCWYTAKVNEAMNNDSLALEEQKRVIFKIISNYVKDPIKTALDYGGNKGATFDDRLAIDRKFVYDISNVDTLNGITKISKYDDLKKYDFDFIMCNMTLEHIANPVDFMRKIKGIGTNKTIFYLEVPSENPFGENKFSVKRNLKLLLNPYYSNIRLIKHYFKVRKEPYMPMHEHVNFFTPKALKTLLERVGFVPINIEENNERGILGDNMVLSALFKKK